MKTVVKNISNWFKNWQKYNKLIKNYEKTTKNLPTIQKKIIKNCKWKLTKISKSCKKLKQKSRKKCWKIWKKSNFIKKDKKMKMCVKYGKNCWK